jgi:hypothetical protein
MSGIQFILVLACMAPLFLLMAIRGVSVVPWEWYFPTFITLAVLPNVYLLVRMWQARHLNDRKRINVVGYTDNREQLITYVFAMLLPLFQSSVSSANDLYASLAATLLVIFIFGHMELYYMNIVLALFGYRVLSVRGSGSPFEVAHVLITKRKSIPPNTQLTPLRITDFLLFEN